MINSADIDALENFVNHYRGHLRVIALYKSNIDKVKKHGLQNINAYLTTQNDPILTLSDEECLSLLQSRISKAEANLQKMTLKGLFREVTEALKGGAE